MVYLLQEESGGSIETDDPRKSEDVVETGQKDRKLHNSHYGSHHGGSK